MSSCTSLSLDPNTGTCYTVTYMIGYIGNVMRIIAKKVLREFWGRHPDAEQSLKAWYQDAKQATWTHPQDIRQTYATASIIANNRIVFNIRGNNYRLIVAINYDFGIIYIRFVGTHREYDQIDAANI